MVFECVKDCLSEIVMKNSQNTINQERAARKIHDYVNSIKGSFDENKYSNQFECEPLFEYYKKTFVDDLERYLSEPNPKDRDEIRRTIIKKAVDAANNDNADSVKQVTKLTSNLISIISSFYKKNSTLFQNTELANHIEKHVDIKTEEIKQDIDSLQAQIEIVESKLSSQINDNGLMILSSLRKSVAENDLDEIRNKMNQFDAMIAPVHELAPYYTAQILRDGKDWTIRSVETSEEALIKFPPTIKCDFEWQLTDEEKKEIDSDILQYAYRNQKEMHLKICSAEKFLGEHKDPYQNEAEKLIGKELRFVPDSFPPPVPCSIIIDGVTVVDYITLGIERIIDDNNILLSNKQQNNACAFVSYIICDNEDNKDLDFKLQLGGNTNRQYLEFLKLIKSLIEGERLEIKNLEEGVNILECSINSFITESDFSSIDEEIELAERIVFIEDYYDKTITVPNTIGAEDYNTVFYLYDFLNGMTIEGTWSSFQPKGTINKDAAKKIDSPKPMFITCNATRDFELFGERFEVETKMEFEEAVFEDYEKFKKKMDCYDEGDIITIKLVPSEENNLFKEKIRN